MSDIKGFERCKDGVLKWVGGIGSRYQDPAEAVRFYWAGELRLGCTERCFSVFSSAPCSKVAKHDPDANGNFTKCGLHSKAAYEKRNAKKDATSARRKRQWAADHAESDAKKALEKLVRAIAEGHNDPRSAAMEAVAALDAARAEVKAAYTK